MAERKNKGLNIVSENLKGDITAPIIEPKKIEEDAMKRTSVFLTLSDIDYINNFLIDEQYRTKKRMTFADALIKIIAYHQEHNK